MIDVAIIGGGITGLTLAYKLSERGSSVALFEKSESTGGVIHTSQRLGCLLEEGPNSFALTEDVSSLLEELALTEELQEPPSSVANKFIAGRSLTGNIKLYRTPQNPLEAFLTGAVSPVNKLRLLFEPLRGKSNTEDEDVYSFFSRRLGRGVTEQIVDTVLGGIWAADIKKLSMRSSLSKVWQLERDHGSLFRGLLYKRQQEGNKHPQIRKPGRRVVSFRKGLSQLTNTLSHKLSPEQLKTRHEVLSLEQVNGIYKITYQHEGCFGVVEAKSVVLATPSGVSAKLLSKIDAPLSQSLETIPYSPLGIIHFLIKDTPLTPAFDGFGFLVQPKLDFASLGVIYSSSLFPDRVPPGYHLLTTFVGGGRNPKLSDVRKPAIVEQVSTELSKILRLKQALTPLQARYYEQAIPSPLVGHFHIVEQLRSAEKSNPGLRVTGNWVTGTSVGERIGEALSLSREISAKALETQRSHASG